MIHGSLFTGFGGFDLAASWMGWDNLFHCEINPFCKQILKHYWPNADSFDDITKTDFTKYRRQIDVLSGGFPCQPYSVAGLRKGKDDARHLWPEMLRAVREIRPRWVVGENVRGLASWDAGLVFEEVCTDLENEGYHVQPIILPAAGVDAPHRRERIWFIAYRNAEQRERETGRFQPEFNAEDFGVVADSAAQREQSRLQSGRNADGLVELEITEQRRDGFNVSSAGLTADSYNIDRRGGGEQNRYEGEKADNCTYQHAADSAGVRGVQADRLRKSGLADETRPADYWRNFPTQSPVCFGNDGLPAGLDGITVSKWRNETIKAAGNAIVPQVALQIFETIELYELLY